jgi:hypothetical protein
MKQQRIKQFRWFDICSLVFAIDKVVWFPHSSLHHTTTRRFDLCITYDGLWFSECNELLNPANAL